MRDFKNNVQVVHLGNLTLSGTTPAASDWVDLRGWDSVVFIPVNNTITDAGTAAGYSAVVQEGDTSAASGASAVDDDDLIGAESALTEATDGNDNTVTGIIGYRGNSRYVRVNYTGTTGTDADVTVIAVLYNGHRVPDANSVGTSVAAT